MFHRNQKNTYVLCIEIQSMSIGMCMYSQYCRCLHLNIRENKPLENIRNEQSIGRKTIYTYCACRTAPVRCTCANAWARTSTTIKASTWADSQRRIYSGSRLNSVIVQQNLRVVHREPVHVDGHVHVFPVLHVPPFEQTGEQTAKAKNRFIEKVLFLSHTCCASRTTPIGCACTNSWT